MRQSEDRHFLICPRKKGNPKMHIDVCGKCRWNLKCPAYREYIEPCLPFKEMKTGCRGS